VRAFIRNLPDPEQVTAGFYMGSDGYVWGRTFSHVDESQNGRLEYDKHWMRMLLWARLAIDPDTPDTFFKAELAKRLPAAGTDALWDAWTSASKIIPAVNRMHWHNWDFQWQVETCTGEHGSFHDVLEWMRCGGMRGAGVAPIKHFVQAPDREWNRTTPFDAADRLETWAGQALSGTEPMQDEPEDELHATVADIRAQALLGRYYAAKFRAATYLAIFERTSETESRDRAIAHIETAAQRMAAYTDHAARYYKPQVLARCGPVDWAALRAAAEKDIELARGLAPRKTP
jgi:hypothetical protein